MNQLVEWIKVGLIFVGVLLLLEARIRLGIKVALVERDLEWIRQTLTKWGMVPPAAIK